MLWGSGRLPLIFGDNLLAISYNNAGCKGLLQCGPGHNLREPAQRLNGHEGRALVYVPVFLSAGQGGQEEVGHKSHVKQEAGGFMQNPELCEVHARVKILLKRANAKRSEQARQVLSEVLGRRQLGMQIAVVLYAMQHEKEKLSQVFALGVRLHSRGGGANSASLRRRGQA